MFKNSLSQDLFISFMQPVADPAPGNNVDIQIPPVAQIELVYLHLKLVTDANSTDRIVRLTPDLTFFPRLLGSSAIAQVASTTFEYVASHNATTNAAGNTAVYTIPLPNIRLVPGPTNVIALTIDNIQVADQISDVLAGWRIWRA